MKLVKKIVGSPNWDGDVDKYGVDFGDRYVSDCKEPGLGWDVAGESAATLNHTLVRKSSVKRVTRLVRHVVQMRKIVVDVYEVDDYSMLVVIQ